MLTFASKQILSAEQIYGLLPPLASRYEKQMPQNLSGNCEINIQMNFSGNPDEIWKAAPSSSSGNFLRFASQVSVNLQETLRVWLPLLWFRDTAQFHDFPLSASLLIYSCCRVFTPRNKQSYTFDVLDGDTNRAILYSARRNICRTLESICTMLTQLGHPCARQYAPLHWDRILAAYQRKPQILQAILVAEREIVEEYVRRPGLMQQPQLLEKSDTMLNRRLKKLFAKKDFTHLRNLLEIEAVHAAAMSLSRENHFSVKFHANSVEFPAHLLHEQNSVLPDSPGSCEPDNSTSGPGTAKSGNQIGSVCRL